MDPGRRTRTLDTLVGPGTGAYPRHEPNCETTVTERSKSFPRVTKVKRWSDVFKHGPRGVSSLKRPQNTLTQLVTLKLRQTKILYMDRIG